MDFIAIDFETANAKRTSACSIGITVVKNNEIVSSEEYLIKPYPFYFDTMNTAIHGIRKEDVEDAPTFAELWEKISSMIDNQIIVAHNSSFDISVLMRTLDYYNIPYPNIDILCTYRISRLLHPDFPCYRLDFLSEHFNIPLCHHNACSDSVACANLLLKYLKEHNVTNRNDISAILGTDFGHVDKNTYYPCRHRFVDFHKYRVQAKEFQNVEITHYDDDFKDKNFVFTGTLLSMSRAKAMEIVASGGGHPQDAVTKKTDYLVVGIQDLKIVKNGQSTKMKRAYELKSKGSSIEVIGEEQFVSMIDEELLDCKNDKSNIDFEHNVISATSENSDSTKFTNTEIQYLKTLKSLFETDILEELTIIHSSGYIEVCDEYPFLKIKVGKKNYMLIRKNIDILLGQFPNAQIEEGSKHEKNYSRIILSYPENIIDFAELIKENYNNCQKSKQNYFNTYNTHKTIPKSVKLITLIG